MASKIYNTINSYISNYNSIVNALGLGIYDGLLAKKLTRTVTREKGDSIDDKVPVVHSDEAVKPEYFDYNGVYYVNYANIYNTLNRNIGGSLYMNQNYDILDEGGNLGQREGILFDQSERETPVFLSDVERDSYTNYINYIKSNYGEPTFSDTSIMLEGKTGYNVGAKRDFEIGGSSNPNGEVDTLLGKISAGILANIVQMRNIRKEERGFTTITNINYYDKGRRDLEESPNLDSLDTALGMSFSETLPNFGIRKETNFIGFGDWNVEYSYSSSTNDYSFFDAWGELSNTTISLSNSTAYNSLKKSAQFSLGTDADSLFMSANPTIDISQFLIKNLKNKGGLINGDSFVTYFGKHNFDIYIDLQSNKNRYKIYTNPADNGAQHVQFHYDEGQIDYEYQTSNPGVNHGTYYTIENTERFGKDLLNVTNKAFRKAKYDTIISKFATQKNNDEDKYTPFQSAISKRFGMSHGRNLLKVEKRGNEYEVNTEGGNGYDNPYCRVWTYHHQYHRLCDTIRPFTEVGDGSCYFNEETDIRNSYQLAKYRNSKIDGTSDIRDRASYNVLQSPGQKLLQERSVINPFNGLVSITPTTPFEPDSQVRTKNCMFSIENLAWKDVLKDKFQLADDQIGPFGGRIMWFPPYGLSFNENVSTSWNSVSFIGRGENIYTYSNTERSGSLSFILLIDHPSILNEWRNETAPNSDVDDINSTEQKILRFFAGCEILDPLKSVPDKEVKENGAAPPPVAEEIIEQPHEPVKGQLSFAVYYPNNYSGCDDTPEDALSYLLNGLGYGMLATYNGDTNLPSDTNSIDFSKLSDIPKGFNSLDYKYFGGSITSDTKIEYSKETCSEIYDGLIRKTKLNSDNINNFYQLYNESIEKSKIGEILNYYAVKDEENIPYTFQFKKFAEELTEDNLYTYGNDNIEQTQKISAYRNDDLVFIRFNNSTLHVLIDSYTFDIIYGNIYQAKEMGGTLDNYEEWVEIKQPKQEDEIIPSKDVTIDGSNPYLGGYEMEISQTEGVSGPYYSQLSNCLLDVSVNKKQVYNSKTTKLYEPINIANNDEVIRSVNILPYNFTAKGSPNPDYIHSWGYRVDDVTFKHNLEWDKKNGKYNDYNDALSYGLNASGYNDSRLEAYHSDFKDHWGEIYSFAEFFAAVMPEYSEKYALKRLKLDSERVNTIRKLLEYGIANIKVKGVASVQGEFKGSHVNAGKDDKISSANDRLSEERGKTVIKWMKTTKYFKDLDNSVWNPETVKIETRPTDGTNNKSSNCDLFEMKATRCAIVTIKYDESISIAAKDAQNIKYDDLSSGSTSGNTYGGSGGGSGGGYGSGGTGNNGSGFTQTSEKSTDGADISYDDIINKNVPYDSEGRIPVRYDGEETFFKTLQVNEPLLHHRIVDKVKYFDPAFHSITPEGFAARLTFLHQCTRQGGTIGASDNASQTATNLAFGRPPICVLRIGDFYYTKIIIDSMSINYENGSGIQWDLNHEGTGVMPMYAKVDLNFKFIGGSDLEGPINRLQNALSFNYYANTRVYDNRSDGIKYDNKGNPVKITPWTPEME